MPFNSFSKKSGLIMSISTIKLNIFCLFKFKAPPSLLVAFFLIGCGGGGSSDGNNPPIDAQTPTITTQPINASYIQNATAIPLSVTANITDGGVLSYQWYKMTNPNDNGNEVSRAIDSTYIPSTSDNGIVYYYVVVTNTNHNINGNRTAVIKSNVAEIAVRVPTIYSISFYDKNLDFIGTLPIAEDANVSVIQSGLWFKAEEYSPTYNIVSDIRLYATENVKEITNQDELNKVRDNLHGKYILLNNITLTDATLGDDSGEGWLPIGSLSSAFSGLFNGNRHKITDFWIDKPSNDYIGFFGVISNAQIRNLGVITKNKEIRGREYVGSIAGYATYSNITNSYSIGNSIMGDGNIGGIVGNIEYGNIINSYSDRNIVYGEYSYIGGIAGVASNVNITNSYSIGNVNGNNYVGGIVGYIPNPSVTNIINSYSIGVISSTTFVGGIAGYYNGNGVMKNNAAINPAIEGKGSNVNRIVGYIGNGDVSNNFALDDMAGGENYYYGKRNSFSNRDDIRYHGIDKTIDQFKMQEIYSNATVSNGLGWKFGNDDDNPWKIDPDKDQHNGYPYFYWQRF
jgi:hypothetical protein